MKHKKNTETKKNRLIDRMNRVLDITPDLIGGGMTIEVYSSRQAVIEGCKNILEYDENMVRVGDDKSEIRFLGCALTLRCLTTENVIIEGDFDSIEFSKV